VCVCVIDFIGVDAVHYKRSGEIVAIFGAYSELDTQGN
jgi:hypothetical protein